ncbi:MAG: hypothetical protein ACJ796_09360 [Gemmatimonadaceae bacterium]
MKSKVLRLLEAAGLQLEQQHWSDLILLHNGARIPPLLAFRGDYVWNWGFNLLIIGPRGTPTHFAKCRAASPEVHRATQLRVSLSHDPACSDVVPTTWGAEHEGLHIEISRYLPGQMYDAILPQLDDRAWTESMRQIAEAADRVSRRVPASLGTNATSVGARVHFRSESARALARLADLGFERTELDLLADLFDAGGSVELRAQHGDLWARNIVRYEKQWWLLDFDLFGQVQVPLYDTCHLVSTSTDQRARNLRRPAKSWLARLRENDVLAQPGLEVIRAMAAREAFTSAEFVAAYVYYLVESATRHYDRGAPREHWEPAISVVRLALDCERNGPTLIELLRATDSESIVSPSAG